MLRRPALVLVLLLPLVVAGCGGSRESERQDVEAAVEGVYNALADKDAKKVCAAISEKGKKQIAEAATRQGKKQSCEQVISVGLAFAGEQLSEAKDVEVTDVKIDGDNAKAAVKLKGRKSEVGLVKENGDWKLSGLGLAGG